MSNEKEILAGYVEFCDIIADERFIFCVCLSIYFSQTDICYRTRLSHLLLQFVPDLFALLHKSCLLLDHELRGNVVTCTKIADLHAYCAYYIDLKTCCAVLVATL